MVSAAGLVAATVGGSTWEELLQRHILNPLNMTNTFTNVTAAVATGNYAIPVAYDSTGKVVPFDADINTVMQPVAPAGIIAYVVLKPGGGDSLVGLLLIDQPQGVCFDDTVPHCCLHGVG